MLHSPKHIMVLVRSRVYAKQVGACQTLVQQSEPQAQERSQQVVLSNALEIGGSANTHVSYSPALYFRKDYWVSEVVYQKGSHNFSC
jgi:hypothetical protein